MILTGTTNFSHDDPSYFGIAKMKRMVASKNIHRHYGP